MRCDGDCIHCQRPYCDDDTRRHEPTGLDAKDPHYKRDCQRKYRRKALRKEFPFLDL